MNPKAPQTGLSKLPTKWLIAIVGLLILYGLTQPLLNRQFGWRLPTLAALLGQEQAAPAAKPPQSGNASQTRVQASPPTREETSDDADNSPALPPTETRPEEREAIPEGASKRAPEPKPSGSRNPKTVESPKPLESSPRTNSGNGAPTRESSISQPRIAERQADAQPANAASGDQLLYGILKETGRDNYVSIAGLRYTPGSEEGHRLKHLERHLADMPTRPGKHGVFEGDMPQVLKWIDDAYQRGTRGAKGTRKTEEENATVYEVPFDKPIGYVGGRDGGRSGHPKARRLRLVVNGNRFITAFPF